MALYCITIPIQKPLCIYNPLSFISQKRLYAIPVQAVVNANYEFAANFFILYKLDARFNGVINV